MSLSVRGNVRTAAAAREGKLPPALKVAFRTGGITGLLCVGLGLIGATTIVFIFQNTATAVLVGFGFGASLIALFMRVGGGIFTKAADVGADLVGKVEAGIPEDDPRNAATIADNVGDNVGDCAGMAADLFESYEITIIASLILGYSAFQSLHLPPARGLLYPLIVAGIGILTSAFGILIVRARRPRQVRHGADQPGLSRRRRPHPHRGVPRRPVLRPRPEGLLGRARSASCSRTWRASSPSTSPRPSRARCKRSPRRPGPGPATTVLAGISIGLESSVWAIIAIVVAIAAAVALGGGKLTVSLYLVALVGIGMLSTTGMIISEDSFGPVSDNAAGDRRDVRRVHRRGRAGHGEPRRRRQHHQGDHQGCRHRLGSHRRGRPVLLVHRDHRQPAAPAQARHGRRLVPQPAHPDQRRHPDDLHRPADRRARSPSCSPRSPSGPSAARRGRSSTRCAASSASTPGSWTTPRSPSTATSSRSAPRPPSASSPRPALLAVLSPVIVGFGINYIALGAFLTGTILTGQLMANFLSNSGGAWDNAKKYIEDGHLGGKGSDSHKAAVIGDTVGDPFKDTAGPALNPLIKVMNLVSLLILPAVITLRHNDAARFAIAGVALLILLASIAFSKRSTGSLESES